VNRLRVAPRWLVQLFATVVRLDLTYLQLAWYDGFLPAQRPRPSHSLAADSNNRTLRDVKSRPSRPRRAKPARVGTSTPLPTSYARRTGDTIAKAQEGTLLRPAIDLGQLMSTVAPRRIKGVRSRRRSYAEQRVVSSREHAPLSRLCWWSWKRECRGRRTGSEPDLSRLTMLNWPSRGRTDGRSVGLARKPACTRCSLET